MDFPRKHCDKADIRNGAVSKCDNPCRNYKEWYKCEKMLMDFLCGKMNELRI